MADKLALLTSAEYTTFLGLGTHYDAETLPQVETSITPATGYRLVAYALPAIGDVTALPTNPVWVQTVARTGDGTSALSHTFTYPSGMVSGNKVIVIQSRSRSGTTMGSSTVPAWWSTIGSGNDGDVSYRGIVEVFAFDVDDYVANGSPASVTITTGSGTAGYSTLQFIEVEPVTGTVEAVFAASADPASISPAAGLAGYLFIAVATRTRTDAVLSGAPSGYSNLTGAGIGTSSGNTSIDRTMYTATKEVASASSEDPGTFTAGSPGGSSRMVVTIAVG